MTACPDQRGGGRLGKRQRTRSLIKKREFGEEHLARSGVKKGEIFGRGSFPQCEVEHWGRAADSFRSSKGGNRGRGNRLVPVFKWGKFWEGQVCVSH